jgi:hypothetical protein
MLPGHRLEVRFADGVRGVVDMSKSDFSGVFASLGSRISRSRRSAMESWFGRMV